MSWIRRTNIRRNRLQHLRLLQCQTREDPQQVSKSPPTRHERAIRKSKRNQPTRKTLFLARKSRLPSFSRTRTTTQYPQSRHFRTRYDRKRRSDPRHDDMQRQTLARSLALLRPARRRACTLRLQHRRMGA